MTAAAGEGPGGYPDWLPARWPVVPSLPVEALGQLVRRLGMQPRRAVRRFYGLHPSGRRSDRSGMV